MIFNMIKVTQIELKSNYFCQYKIINDMDNIQDIHEVLHLLFNTDKEYTVKKLYRELKIIFGDDVCFTNCADNVFPIQEVVPFLLSREKIRLSENTIIPLTHVCDC